MIGDLTVFLYSVCFLTAVLTILPFYLFVYMEASPSGGVLLAFVVLAFIDVYFLIQIFKVITKEHLKVYENGFVLPKTPGRFTPLGGFVAYNDITGVRFTSYGMAVDLQLIDGVSILLHWSESEKAYPMIADRIIGHFKLKDHPDFSVMDKWHTYKTDDERKAAFLRNVEINRRFREPGSIPFDMIVAAQAGRARALPEERGGTAATHGSMELRERRRSRRIYAFTALAVAMLIAAGTAGYHYITVYSWGADGRLSLELEGDAINMSVNDTSTTRYILSNTGDTDLRVLWTEPCLGVRLFHSGNNTSVRWLGPAVKPVPDSYFTNDKLAVVNAHSSISGMAQVSKELWDIRQNETYKLVVYLWCKSTYPDITVPYWKGTLKSNEIRINVN